MRGAQQIGRQSQEILKAGRPASRWDIGVRTGRAWKVNKCWRKRESGQDIGDWLV